MYRNSQKEFFLYKLALIIKIAIATLSIHFATVINIFDDLYE